MPQAGLQQCMDYVLFPLVMMLDAAAALRQPPNGSSSERGQQAGSAAAVAAEGEAGALMALPAMSSDRAVEAVLGCVRVLLRRCAFQAGQGLLGLLRRLAAMLALPEVTASEETRQQVRMLHEGVGWSPLGRVHSVGQGRKACSMLHGACGIRCSRARAAQRSVHGTSEGKRGEKRRRSERIRVCRWPGLSTSHPAQALLCVEAAAAGVLRREAPPTVRQALLAEEAAPLLGYLSSLLLQVRVNCRRFCWASAWSLLC